MISISKFRKIAGKEAENKTDEELEEIRDAQYQFAELAFEMWVRKKGIVEKIQK